MRTRSSPSLISNSAMPLSLTRSISVLSLRRSMMVCLFLRRKKKRFSKKAERPSFISNRCCCQYSGGHREPLPETLFPSKRLGNDCFARKKG
ncbi:hypothetical protein EVA_06515 [gut metagenome]|uniref:Uncharacterized protein n=1 Tax=gut metagenome TaxID=749906 RepID=J9GS09_9ZZZZ